MKWEYKVVNTTNISKFSDPIKLQDELNNYGKEGWELVGFVYPPQTGEGWLPKSDIDSALFKRQIPEN